jgi:hypothetical protein
MRIFQTHVNVSTLSFDSKDNSRRKLAEALFDATQLRSVSLPARVDIEALERLAASDKITSITLLDEDAPNTKHIKDVVAHQPGLAQLVSFRQHFPVGYLSIASEPLANYRQLLAPRNTCDSASDRSHFYTTPTSLARVTGEIMEPHSLLCYRV